MQDDFEFLSDYLSPREIKRLNKKSKKEKTVYRSRSSRGSQQIIDEDVINIQIKELKAKTLSQQALLDSLNYFDQIIALGPAGTGKTYVSTAFLARQLLQKKIEKIIITRPNIATGKTLGLFPGSVEDKMLVWCQPVVQVLKQYLGDSYFEYCLKKGIIVLQPLETIRGMSFNNCGIIIDECQNIETEEIKALVTRIGENSKIIFSGDLKQSDLHKFNNGLNFLINCINDNEELQNFSAIVEFNIDDVVRSDLCKAWVKHFYYM